ncbi:unnamed protein product [Miscanthus lutarioriparius]|uniref:Uncharacterized protein n=1 Tax=Miscanthus lutarioriparius TaxID=422564 RepID=A0A811NSZ2_9POAL|nr:unnamed protein product [Miscanthus lutarioriparius]
MPSRTPPPIRVREDGQYISRRRCSDAVSPILHIPHSVPFRREKKHRKMCFADSKRPLEMVLYDPAAVAACQSQQRANKRARPDEAAAAKSSSSSSSSAAASGAMVPYAGMTVLDVAPISSAPPLQLRPPPPAAGAGREEPPCLRRHFLVALGLRADLPVHFIGDKCVTSTDLDAHQNRFRIPREGVDRRLRPILSPQELDAANLLEDPSPVPRKKRPRQRQEQEQQQQQPGPSEPQQNGAAEGKKMKKPKKKGKVHGGLRVKLVGLDAGAKEVQMSRWESSLGTIVKGEGYLHFIRQCGFKERDNVEIWAFVQRRFHLFGADVCDGSLLHLLVVKKQEEPRCCYCRAPAHVPPVPVPVPVPGSWLPRPAVESIHPSEFVNVESRQDPIRYTIL